MKYCSAQIKYLAAVRELSAEKEDVKSVDISRYLGVSRASVSKTMRCLANSGLVYEDFCNSVVLTPEGENAIQEIFRDYDEIYAFFHRFLKLPPEDARAQAVTFITIFPEETADRLKKLVKRSYRK
ncbi:MAG: metal-dependent transcriptional regulator [Alistipes sp.]|nr:metal-dependent transcriptional regulator [Alistipes sp.]